MLYAQKKDRERRFTLALRTVIPSLLLVVTLFVLFYKQNEYLLFFTLIIAASLIITYYNLYVIYKGFDENIIDRNTLVFDFKYFKHLVLKQRKKASHYSMLMIQVVDIDTINAHYGREKANETLKEGIALLIRRIEHIGYKKFPVSYYGGGYFILAFDAPKEEIIESFKTILSPHKSYYINDIEFSVESAIIDAKELPFDSLIKNLIHLVHKEHFDLLSFENDEKNGLNTIEKRVYNGIFSRSLSLQFQAVMHAQSKRIDIIEFSAKLIDCQGQFVHHNELLPVINRLGLEKQFYLMVLDEIAKVVSAKNIRQKFAMTISAFTLRNREVFDAVLRIMQNYDIKPGQLILIVQEERYYRHIERYKKIIANYRDKGVLIAFSKVGSNNPSLEYLKHFQVDFVKYDGSFCSGIKDAYVRSIYDGIDTAMKKRGIKRWATMVEDENIAQALELLDIDYMQGWYIGKFMAIEHIEHTLLKEYNEVR